MEECGGIGMSKRSWTFVLLSYGIAWILWGSQIAEAASWPVPVLILQLAMIATWAPLMARLLVEGQMPMAGLKMFWKDFAAEPRKMMWLGIVVIMGMGPPLIAQVVTGRLTGQALAWSYPPAVWGLVWISILVVGGGFEEFGWRGWLYPELRKTWTPFTAGIVVGVIHALWHLPLHFIPGTVQAAIPFWQFFLMTATSGWIYAWILMGTKGVFAAVMYHTFANFGAALSSYWMVPRGRWIVFGIQSLLVLALFAHSRHKWNKLAG
jgi:hypothetical protein